MKHFKFTNYFNALSPVLESHETEEFFPHPKLPGIKCNQLGALYIDETLYVIQHYRRGIGLEDLDGYALGTKSRIVWECYRGYSYPEKRSPNFWYLNGNVNDFTKQNLFLTSEMTLDEERLAVKNRNSFVAKSVERLIKLEEKYLPSGLDIDSLYQILFVPSWLSHARKRTAGEQADKIPITYTGRTATEISDQDVEKVVRLYKKGWGKMAIAKEMGWRSKCKVNRILKENSIK